MKKQTQNSPGFFKTISMLFCTLSALMLTGCAADDFILHHFGDLSEADYQTYIALKASEQLNENGFYVASEINNAEETATPPMAASM